MAPYFHSTFNSLFPEIKQDVILPPYQIYLEVKQRLVNNGFTFNGSSLDSLELIVCFTCHTMSTPEVDTSPTPLQQPQYPSCSLCKQPAPLLSHITVLYYQKAVSDLGGLWLHKKTHQLLNHHEINSMIEQAYALKTSPCFDLRKNSLPRMLILEGNLGVGKSTLIQSLKEHYKDMDEIQFMKEPVELWGQVLGKYYTHQEKWAATLQTVICVTFVQEVFRAINNYPALKLLICDRSVLTGPHTFSKVLLSYNVISPRQFQYIMETAENMNSLLPIESSFRLFLRQTPQVCAQRIAARARTEELSVPLHYLRSVELEHNNWNNELGSSSCTLLPQQADLQTLRKIIDLALQGVIEFKNGTIQVSKPINTHITLCTHPEHGGFSPRPTIPPSPYFDSNPPFSPITPPIEDISWPPMTRDNSPSTANEKEMHSKSPEISSVIEEIAHLQPEVIESSESQIIDISLDTHSESSTEKDPRTRRETSSSLPIELEDITDSDEDILRIADNKGKNGFGAKARLDFRPPPRHSSKKSKAISRRPPQPLAVARKKIFETANESPFLPHIKH